MHSYKPVRTAKVSYIIMSVLIFALGITIMVFPSLPKIVICRVIGAFLCAYGIIKIIGYFSNDLYSLAFQFDLAYGLLIIVLGAVMIIFTENFVSALGFILGVVILVDALFKIQSSVDAKKFGLSKWWLIALFAIITVLAGIFLVIDPITAVDAATYLAGIALALEGVMNIVVAVSAIKIVKSQSDEK